MEEFIGKLKGIFVLDIIDAHTGENIEHYEDHNLIVNGGRTTIVTLLGAATSGKKLTKLSVGTNGTAPTSTDVSPLTGSFTKSLGTVSYPSISSVKFDWQLGASEANGIGIREFGLLSTDDTLFARKVRELINKNSDIILNGSWTITF